MQTPIAKQANLIVEDLESETVIYDKAANEAHCLDATAAFVWKRCDGKRTIEQLRMELAEQVDQGVSEDELLELIKMLEAKGLTEVSRPTNDVPSMSRRGVLGKAIVIGTLSVTIQSIVAPTPAHAASCGSGGGTTGCQPTHQGTPTHPCTHRQHHGFLRMILQAILRLLMRS